MEDAILAQLRRIRDRYDDLTREMGRPDVASNFEEVNQLAKERSGIERVVSLLDSFETATAALQGARALMEEDDPELRALAEVEIAETEKLLETLDQTLMHELLPGDPRDRRNVIMEIRGGTGGEEAAIFAADLYRM